MAIRTVAAGGGNFNTAGTWVGGVAPVAGDSIIANATSGNLTISTNTVSIVSADFTGYTGTLAFGGNQMIFNTSAATLTIGSGMTITFSASGYFRIQQSATITSNGKSLPLSLNSASATFTLSGSLTASLLQNAQGTITGNDLIITATAPPDLSTLIIATGYKCWLRPSGTATLNTTGLGTGYFVFDTTNTITLNQPMSLQPNTAAAVTQTVEFAKTAVWNGGGTLNGKPNFFYNVSAAAWNNSNFSIVMTAVNYINELMFYMPIGSTNNINWNLTNKFITDVLTVITIPAAAMTKATLNVLGSGGFSASNVYIDNSKTATGASFNMNTAQVKLTADATYTIGELLMSGTPNSGSAGGASPSYSTLSSYTASVPASVAITGGSYGFAQITDIDNTGTVQYALVANGNILTRTTGFVDTPSSGGGGSFTYVN